MGLFGRKPKGKDPVSPYQDPSDLDSFITNTFLKDAGFANRFFKKTLANWIDIAQLEDYSSLLSNSAIYASLTESESKLQVRPKNLFDHSGYTFPTNQDGSFIRCPTCDFHLVYVLKVGSLSPSNIVQYYPDALPSDNFLRCPSCKMNKKVDMENLYQLIGMDFERGLMIKKNNEFSVTF